jgi:hypothetical protein
MQTLSPSTMSLVATAANDLPVNGSVDRARRRERDRKLRGPTWAEPRSEIIPA